MGQYTEVDIRCPVGTWTIIKSFQFPKDEELHHTFIEFGVQVVGGTIDANIIMRLSRTGAGVWSESSFYVSKNSTLRCTSASIIWAYENSTYNIEILSRNSQITVIHFLLRPFIFYHG